MKTRRLLAGVAGVAALCVALATDAALPVESLVDSVGSDYLVVASVGGAALLLSVPVVLSGRGANLEQTETPDPEWPATAAPAGRELDETRTSLALALPVVGAERRARLRERLRQTAAGAVARSRGCSHRTALTRVEQGEWCSDPVAATFLADGTTLSPRALAGSLRHATHPYDYATRRVVRVVLATEREGST